MSCVVCLLLVFSCLSLFFFFNDTATTEIYTLSLHDALPISPAAGPRLERRRRDSRRGRSARAARPDSRPHPHGDRKSTRLNSSHSQISYAVFCLKKKKKHIQTLLARRTDYSVSMTHTTMRPT